MSTARRKVVMMHLVAHIRDKHFSHVFMFIIPFYFICAMVVDLVIQIFMFVCKMDGCYRLLIRVVVLCISLLFIFSSSETMTVAPWY